MATNTYNAYDINTPWFGIQSTADVIRDIRQWNAENSDGNMRRVPVAVGNEVRVMTIPVETYNQFASTGADLYNPRSFQLTDPDINGDGTFEFTPQQSQQTQQTNPNDKNNNGIDDTVESQTAAYNTWKAGTDQASQNWYDFFFGKEGEEGGGQIGQLRKAKRGQMDAYAQNAQRQMRGGLEDIQKGLAKRGMQYSTQGSKSQNDLLSAMSNNAALYSSGLESDYQDEVSNAFNQYFDITKNARDSALEQGINIDNTAWDRGQTLYNNALTEQQYEDALAQQEFQNWMNSILSIADITTSLIPKPGGTPPVPAG